MSDNRRRFVTVHRALKALYPTEPRGNQARHLTTLAMIISGIVGSKNVHLGAIASKVPTPTWKVRGKSRHSKADFSQINGLTLMAIICPMPNGL